MSTRWIAALCVTGCVALPPSARAWETAPSLPGGSREYAAGVNRSGTLFVIGGMPFDGNGDAVVHFLPPGATEWTAGRSVEGPVVRQGAGIDALGRIIVFGGVDGTDPEGDLGGAYVYDPNEGQYQSIAERGADAPPDWFAYATDDAGRIYSFGGGPGENASAGNPNSTYVERYDGSADAWQPLAPLPDGRADAAAVFDGRGHILVLGGVDAQATTRLATVVRYDIAAGTWAAGVVADLPVALSGLRAVLGADQRVYAVGGRSGPIGAGTTQATVYALDQDTNTWSSEPSLTEPRRNFAIAFGDDDFVYACGGTNESGGTSAVEKLFTPTCPIVTAGPLDLVAWRGALAGFAVDVDGTSPFTFQWRRDGVDLMDGPTGTGSEISGATTANLMILDPGDADAGQYDVAITNACGLTISPAGALTLDTPPAIPDAWEVFSIHPGWATGGSTARGIGAGRVGGEVTTATELPDGRILNLGHPVVWDTDTYTSQDLTPGDSIGGAILDVEGDLLGGWFWRIYSCPPWTCGWQSAAFWTAPNYVFAEASHSSGAEYDYVYGTDGVHLVGMLAYEYSDGFYDFKAHMWTADNHGISLHFADALDTAAVAVEGDRQYGWYYPTTAAVRAVMWSGTADSHVDIHPTGYASSSIDGAGDGQVVGEADSDAGLWVAAPAAFRSLHPAGAGQSSALAVRQGVQVGGVDGRAALWVGSPDTYVDLGLFVSVEFTSSSAQDLAIAADGTITVVGYGYNATAGRNEALVWRSLADEPCEGDIDGNDAVDLTDLSILLSNFGTASGASFEDGDLDGDGDVDLADLSVLLANFGRSCG